MCLYPALLIDVVTQLGGEEAAPQSVSQEIDASMKEGNDPLPRTPQSWLNMKYTDVSTHIQSTRSKKLAGDGVRAVAALVAQVSSHPFPTCYKMCTVQIDWLLSAKVGLVNSH